MEKKSWIERMKEADKKNDEEMKAMWAKNKWKILGVAAALVIGYNLLPEYVPPTPEEIAAKELQQEQAAAKERQRSYEYHCYEFGYNQTAYDLGAVSKYKDRAGLHYQGMLEDVAKYDDLDEGNCKIQARAGGMYAAEKVSDNKIEMRRGY